MDTWEVRGRPFMIWWAEDKKNWLRLLLLPPFSYLSQKNYTDEVIEKKNHFENHPQVINGCPLIDCYLVYIYLYVISIDLIYSHITDLFIICVYLIHWTCLRDLRSKGSDHNFTMFFFSTWKFNFKVGEGVKSCQSRKKNYLNFPWKVMEFDKQQQHNKKVYFSRSTLYIISKVATPVNVNDFGVTAIPV